jgi:arylsulfatase
MSADRDFDRRSLLLGSTSLAAASVLGSIGQTTLAQTQPAPAPTPTAGKRPNILVIFGDDIGQSNISAYTFALMGYRTPNIDRIAREGMMFTDYYAGQSCTAGRSSFITGQATLRTGLSKVGIPGATIGLQAQDITIAEALKPLGYATGQFGKAIATNFCRPRTASTSSSATSTTSMPKRTPRTRTIRRTLASRRGLARGA